MELTLNKNIKDNEKMRQSFMNLAVEVFDLSFEDDSMICYDIYCDEGKCRDEILSAVAQADTRKVTFGFMPKDTVHCTVGELENEDQLFVFKNKENMFTEEAMMLPMLSHA